jgi:hypothetical protein
MSDQPAATPDAGPDRGPPYQMDVYFQGYPTLDHEALARFVGGCEPGGEGCEVRPIEDSEGPQGRRVGGFTVFLGELMVAALVHNFPSPASGFLPYAGLRKSDRDDLAAHGAFALLNQIGGEGLRPVERMLFLYKVAAGLCVQGALGVGHFHVQLAFPGGVMRELFDRPDGGAAPLFRALRETGEPIELLARYVRLELLGRRYLVTSGFGYCGIPELAWEYTTQEEASEVAEAFKNCFVYMMEHGPVIRAGHTIGDAQSVAFRFSEPPEGFELPFPSVGVLLLRKETGRPRGR